MQLFSTTNTSSNHRNQAPLFTELCLLQGTQNLHLKTQSWLQSLRSAICHTHEKQNTTRTWNANAVVMNF